MSYALRPYQSELLAKIRQSMKTGHKHIVVQSPPRTGKTVVMAQIAKQATDKGNHVMFIVHRKEVLEQAKNTFLAQGVNPDLLQAGMVQTFTRRLDKLKEPSIIFCDEAHHALAKSYRRIFNIFPKAYLLLFTATPYRLGKEQLDKIADDLIVGQSIKDLTKHGFLAPFRYYSVPYNDVDKKKLKMSSTGDYTEASIDQALGHSIWGHTVDQYLKHADGMQAVAYTHSVNAAKRLAETFNKRGISAQEVDGQTPPKVRDKVVSDFRNKKVKILVNVNLFTEGIDLPNVDCVLMVRPTQSLSLYMQFAMRCLNPREGKTAVIVDQVGNYLKFDLPNADRNWKKLIRTRKHKKKSSNDNLSTKTCPSCYAVVERKKIKNGRCPMCGYYPLIIHENKDKDRKKGDLVEINESSAHQAVKKRLERVHELVRNRALLSVADKSIGELENIAELKAYGELHGYKPGWAWYQAKQRGWIH